MLNISIKLITLFLFSFFPLGHTNPDNTVASQKEALVTETIQTTDDYYSWFYNQIKTEGVLPGYEAFENALSGFFNLKNTGSVSSNFLTIIDFSVSSNQERMWIVDMNRMEVVHNSLVAHGRNSGQEFASSFSNISGSYKSSLGIYLTESIYQGKHGTSLYLDGLEPEINDNARKRTIVMHSAGYVSTDFIKKNGRLGRSYGCPAIPADNHEEILTMISGGSVVYVHYPDHTYMAGSSLISRETAIEGMHRFLTEPLLVFPVSEISRMVSI